jgi:DNA polymerase delta subunit 1
MPEAIVPPHKRVLGDAVNNTGVMKSPSVLKKRKLDNEPSVSLTPSSQTARRKIGSTQPQKSQFEQEVLEKLTQDIGDLKENNSEKDQQWERPPVKSFDETKENICFQQIDAEEAMLMGKPAIRLFGVTEVNRAAIHCAYKRLTVTLGRTICLSSRYRLRALPLHRRPR